MKYSFRISYSHSNAAGYSTGEDYYSTAESSASGPGMQKAIVEALKQMPTDQLRELEKLIEQVRLGFA